MDALKALAGVLSPLALPLVLARAADAQCLDWADGFALPGADGPVLASTVHDDGLGGGPMLHVGGRFTSVGGAEAASVARWRGGALEPLGSGLLLLGPANAVSPGTALALVSHDDGTGPRLYVGGLFTTAGGAPAANVARWDGLAWSAVGSGIDGEVRALVVFDEGHGLGPCLIAGGAFRGADGQVAERLARWDGTSWSQVGGGLPKPDAEVHALAVFDDGAGRALYVGGSFDQVGMTAVSNVARWDGIAWSPLGAGTDLPVRALVVHDDGSGPALFAGGDFSEAGGLPSSRVARWDGQAWSALGAGVDGAAHALAVHDEGNGAVLFAAGDFTTAGGLAASGVARWSQGSWSTAGSGVQGSAGASVRTLCSAHLGQPGGSVLVVGGDLEGAGGVAATHLAAWDGATWSPLLTGEGVLVRFSDTGIWTLAGFDDGTGAALYAGGSFSSTGAALLAGPGLARWIGGGWEALPDCPWLDGWTSCMAVFDPGTGPGLFVGTTGGRVACWRGGAWDPSLALRLRPTNGSMAAGVAALVVHDDGSGPALYVGGGFIGSCGGGVTNLLRWDGSTCTSVGALPGPVSALASFDDGTGPALYAAGVTFSTPPAPYLERWDGSAWTSIGHSHLAVASFAVFDDGSGPMLHAAGGYGVWRWTGTSWQGLVSNPVRVIAVHHDGGGPALYAAGATSMIGVPVNTIARWDGQVWSPLGVGIERTPSDMAHALCSYDDGAGPRLWVGGAFHRAGGRPSAGIARWGDACGCEPVTYCLPKVSSAACIPSMQVTGTASLTSGSPLVLAAGQVLANKPGLLFYGTRGPGPYWFQGGTLCVEGPSKRTSLQWSGGSSPPDDCSGRFSLDFRALALSGVDPALVAGTSVYAQYWYRDPADSYGVGLTDAAAFTLCP